MGDNLGGLDVLGDDDEFSDPSLYRLRRLIRALPHFARPRGLPQYLVGCFGYFLRRLELHVVRLGGHLKNRPLTARYPRYLRVGRSGEFGARISTETRGRACLARSFLRRAVERRQASLWECTTQNFASEQTLPVSKKSWHFTDLL